MKLGMIGLGRMGANMARRLARAGHECVLWDRTPQVSRKLAEETGAEQALDFASLKAKLGSPAFVWVMLPAGKVTEDTVLRLSEILSPGDTVIDGGNSYFKDDVRHAKLLGDKGVRYLDVGTSGGTWGLDRGYSLMIGGDQDAATALDPVFASLAPGSAAAPPSPNRVKAGTADRGYLYCGPAGSGHFVKMVHNGIEYGMMQALAEGFHVLQGASRDSVPPHLRYRLDLREVAEVWRRGSVVSSWLLDLTAIALNEDAALSSFTGQVSDSGEGRWTVQAAIEEGVPATVLSASLFARFLSREDSSFADKLLSAMRFQFGGHREPPREERAS